MIVKALRAPLLMILVAFVFLVLLSHSSFAHEKYGAHGDGHDVLHHWYETLKQPISGMSCCNDQDCRPTVSRTVGDTVQVIVDGEWTNVPPEKIVRTPSPDLGSHVCAPKISNSKPKHLFCVVLGGGV